MKTHESINTRNVSPHLEAKRKRKQTAQIRASGRKLDILRKKGLIPEGVSLGSTPPVE